MLEFFKKIIGNNIFRTKTDKIDDGVSYVADKELEQKIKILLRNIGLENVSFSVILSRLGLENNKIIYLKKVFNDNDLSFYYGYESDVSNSDRIDFVIKESYTNGSDDNNSCKIVLSGDGYRKRYRCCYNSYDKDGIKLEKQEDMVIKNINDCQYIRRVEPYGLWIKVCNKDGDEIILNCTGRFRIQINNEMELEQYLTNLSFSESIIDVYKNVCKISIGDEGKYSKFDITVYKNDKVDSSFSYEKEDLFSIFTPMRIYEVKSKDRDVSYYRYLTDFRNIRNYNNLSGDTVKIEVEKGDYRFVLEVKIGDGKLKEDAKLNNELELRDYLVDLEFPVAIDELYKKICEISLGDVSKYENVKLDCYFKNINIDSLYLHYGKFMFYKMIRDGKEVVLDEDGMFTYKVNGKIIMASIDISDDNVDKNELTYENDTDRLMQDMVSEARDVKVRTRNMIDEMLSNSKNDGN